MPGGRLGNSLHDLPDASHLGAEAPRRFAVRVRGGSTVMRSLRPARRWCRASAATPSTSGTGKSPVGPPDSACAAARPGNSGGRGRHASKYGSRRVFRREP
ncbi:hypothetical protein [Streptomyces chryseus]